MKDPALCFDTLHCLALLTSRERNREGGERTNLFHSYSASVNATING